MIKAIIFDLWGTTATKDVHLTKTLSEHFKIKKDLKKYEKSVQLKKWKTEKEMAKAYLKEHKLETTKENIDYTISVFQGSTKTTRWIEGMEKLVEELRKKYKIGLLSNTSNWQAKGAEKKLGLKKKFDKIVYSWQIGTKKPNKKNFQEICKKLKVKFQETIFIDDTKENLEKAKEMGIKTIHFKNAKKTKEDIKRYPEE